MMILFWLLLAVCSFWVNAGGARAACNHPPELWCTSTEITLACQAQKHCGNLATRLATRVPSSPVSLTLYYESLCPYCRYFVTQQLFPTWVMLNEIMTVTLVPYGNAEETKKEGKWYFTCQHGTDECLGNMIEVCLIYLLKDINVSLPIISCMESNENVIRNLKPCLQVYAPNVTEASVMACVKGDLGNELMHQNAQLTKSLKPPHRYVPWIIIDGKHTEQLQDRALESLFLLACDLYKGDPPSACRRKSQRLTPPASPQHLCMKS